jgi:U6 snRNA-associated Sm-like protein LSm4
MNINLKEVIFTAPNGSKFMRIPEIYIKGNTIKYLRIPELVVDKVKDEQGRQQRRGFNNFQKNNKSQRGGRGISKKKQ